MPQGRGSWCRSRPRSFHCFMLPNGSCAGSWSRRSLVFLSRSLLSWFYEWTPKGLQLESEIPPNESITRQTGKKLDRWIIAILALAVILLLADKLVLHKDANSNSDKAAATSAEKSIAVLPFVNMTSDKENEYFADGLSEEILNSLARIDGMRVVGRTSSFQFKGKDVDLRTIGEKLGAANVLEGSVRREGERARITAQLIRTSDGIHLWSQTYDRTLTDTLAVQLNIAEQVAGVLDVVLDDKQRERDARRRGEECGCLHRLSKRLEALRRCAQLGA